MNKRRLLENAIEGPRRIVLVLGNGFDIDLGLGTSYKDFWETDFCPKTYPAPIIKHLNERWGNNLESVRWYDLENELLAYYKKVESNKVKDVLSRSEVDFLKYVKPSMWGLNTYNRYLDPVESLREKGYISLGLNSETIEIPYHDDLLKSSVWRDQRALTLIKENLCKYLRSIDILIPECLAVAFYLLLAMTKTATEGNVIDIFTFNYTRVRMRGHNLKNIPVHYMHGSCEEGKIIIGTRDDLNVDPAYDFILKAMDGSFSPPDIITPLKTADEVIIFGHSLGENDRQYFAPFFLRQANEDNTERKDITIFTRDTNSKNDIKRALQKMTNGKLSSLYSINQPIIIRTNNLEEDQQLMLDFFVNHNLDEDYAEKVICELKKKYKNRIEEHKEET